MDYRQLEKEEKNVAEGIAGVGIVRFRDPPSFSQSALRMPCSHVSHRCLFQCQISS